jgi:predicted nucleotidyltransferase
MRAHDRESLLALLSEVSDAFKPKGEVRLYAMGGTALTLLGIKESTMDIDFLLEGWNQLHELISAFRYARPKGLGKMLFQEHRDEGSAILEFPEAMIRIDLYAGVVSGVVLSPGMVKRSSSLANMDWIQLRSLSPEDIILLKMRAGREKDLEDISTTLRTRGAKWDVIVSELIWQMKHSLEGDKLIYWILNNLLEWKGRLAFPRRLVEVLGELLRIDRPKLLKFVYDSRSSPREVVKEILRLLDEIRDFGVRVEFVDLAGREGERLDLYLRLAAIVAALRRYEVRRVFGSRRNPGFLFGREEPALVVFYEERDTPQDVYPHKSQLKGAPDLTIRDFLEILLAKLARTGSS